MLRNWKTVGPPDSLVLEKAATSLDSVILFEDKGKLLTSLSLRWDAPPDHSQTAGPEVLPFTAPFPLIAFVFLSLTEASVSALAVQPSGASGCRSGWC